MVVVVAVMMMQLFDSLSLFPLSYLPFTVVSTTAIIADNQFLNCANFFYCVVQYSLETYDNLTFGLETSICSVSFKSDIIVITVVISWFAAITPFCD